MDINILKNLIDENLSHRGIAKEIGVSQTTVKYWLNKYGLKTNKKLIKEFCELCGKNFKQYNEKNRSKCGSCTTRIRRYRTKERAIKYLGGKCNRCDLKHKNIAVYEFHHKNDDKDFTIGSANNKSWEVVKKELDKCELLCSNCHKIEHSKYNEDDNFMDAVKKYKGK